eukprot:COSAG06_NODE_43821_length_368_cov_1.449814_1_plen_43_part_01
MYRERLDGRKLPGSATVAEPAEALAPQAAWWYWVAFAQAGAVF